MNRCDFIGNLGKDPEIRYTASSEAVASISIGCTERWKDSRGEKQERTEWVRAVAFGKLAEVVKDYVHKGDKVYISGRQATRKWQDNNGEDRYSTEIVIRELEMLGSPRGSDDRGRRGRDDDRGRNDRGRSGRGDPPRRSDPGPSYDDEFDDDIPF